MTLLGVKGLKGGAKELRTFNCFVAGTPVLTPDGAQPIETLRPGDYVLTRDEDDPDGPVTAHRVALVFARVSPVLDVVVEGQVIGTTGEHPFYVRGRGWQEAGCLRSGNELLGHDGKWVPVAGINDSGRVQTVYNVEVEASHTYFVGKAEWGFSAWVHNANCSIKALKNGKYELINNTTGKSLGKFKTANQAVSHAHANNHKVVGKFRKPPYAPTPKKWIANGGTIKVSNKGVWTYTKGGVSVPYPGGYPKFPKKYVRQTVRVPGLTGKNTDFTLADKVAATGKGKKLPQNTWHHHQNGKDMIEVDSTVHELFTHIGGASKLRVP